MTTLSLNNSNVKPVDAKFHESNDISVGAPINSPYTPGSTDPLTGISTRTEPAAPSELVNPNANSFFDNKTPTEDRSLTLDTLTNYNILGTISKGIANYEYFQPKDDFDLLRDHPDWLHGLSDDEHDYVITSRSEEEAKHKLDNIFDEREALQNIEDSGYGTALAIGASILDPTNLIPLSTGAKIFKAANTGIKLSEAASAGVTIGGIAAAEEAVFQNTQMNRTAEESAMNIGTGAIMAHGMTHIVNKYFGTPNTTEFINKTNVNDDPLHFDVTPDHIPDHVPLDDTMHFQDAGAAATPKLNPEDTRMVGGSVAETMSLGKGARLASSSFDSARALHLETADTAFRVKAHEKGHKFDTAESQIHQLTNKELGTVYRDVEKGFSEVKKTTNMSRNEFNTRVSRYGRDGYDFTSEHPSIVQAARTLRKFYDTLGKRLHENGFISDPDKVKGAAFYIPRVYDRLKIKANYKQFHDNLSAGLENQISSMSKKDLKKFLEDQVTTDIKVIAHDIASDITDSILNGAQEFQKTASRKVSLSDLQLEDWLINDPFLVAKRYGDKYIPKIVMHEKFGTKSFEEWAAPIHQERHNRIMAGEDAILVNKEHDIVINRAESLYNHIMNVNPKVSNKELAAITNTALKYSAMTKLGLVTLSSLTDMARATIVDGISANLKHQFKSLVSVLDDKSLSSLSRQEMQMIVAPLEDLNGRFNQFNELLDDYSSSNDKVQAIHNLTDWMHGRFMKMTQLSRWTANQKTTVGMISANKIIKAGEKLSLGKTLTTKDKSYFASIGLDEQRIQTITAQYKKHGNGELLNIHDWDQTAVDYMEQSLIRQTNKTINTVGAGDLPVYMDTLLGKVLGQFQSFAMTAWNQTLIAGLQSKDANFYISTVMAMAIGTAVTQVRAKISGKEPPKELYGYDGLLYKAVEASGLIAMPVEAINRTAAAFGAPSINKMLGSKNKSNRYRQDGQVEWGRIVGPLGSTLENTAKSIAPYMPDGKLQQANVEARIKMLPFGNVLTQSRINDAIGKGMSRHFGIPWKENKDK